MGAIRRPREGACLSVQSDAFSACTVHPVPLGTTAGTPPVAGVPASGKAPCQPPVCPSCGSRDRRSLLLTNDASPLADDHGGQAQTSEGRCTPTVSPLPRRHPFGDGMVALSAGSLFNCQLLPVCFPPDPLSAGVLPAVLPVVSESFPR